METSLVFCRFIDFILSLVHKIDRSLILIGNRDSYFLDRKPRQYELVQHLGEATGNHHLDRVDLHFSQADHCDCEVDQIADLQVSVREVNRSVTEEGRDENRDAGGQNHCNDSRAKRLENSFHQAQVAVFRVELCENRDKDAGREDTADRCDDRARNSGNLIADER